MIGFTIQPIRRRVSADLIENFRTIPVANASDCMSRLNGQRPEATAISRRDGVMWARIHGEDPAGR